MRGIDGMNPAVLMFYYICVIGTAMFCMNPVIIIISLIGSAAFYISTDRKKNAGIHISFLILFLLLSVINPIWYHNGVTVLFVVNDSPVTLEALLYGVFAAAMIVSVLYRFRTFTFIMTADKLMYVFGRFSPKAALILSMALRYIPLMRAQNAKIRNTQKAMGMYRDDNIADTLKGEIRIFSIMTTWSLENGIITADSMEARGYGSHRRTSFSVFRFRASDAVFLVICVLLTGICMTAIISGDLDFGFYPAMTPIPDSALAISGYISYGILSFLTAAVKWKEDIKWKYLISGI